MSLHLKCVLCGLDMDICHCNQDDCENPLYCEAHSSNPDEEARLPTELFVKDEERNLEFKLLLGNALFEEHACLVVQILEPDTTLTLNPSRETLFGRFDPTDPNPSQVDLTPYDGRKRGVSRLHAAIYRAKHTLMLADLGSSNGTYLNGDRLRPQQTRVLRDGDEIRFGQLAARINFR